jgi:hypothetical protein
MKCAVHADLDATGFCRHCGKPMCAQCTREVRGTLYCEPCLADLLVPLQSERQREGTDAHPGIAFALGFIPGLGAVYNGEYVKALIHVVIFGGLIAALSSDLSSGYEAFLGIALSCFYLYMPIEAHRVAKTHRAGAPEPIPAVPIADGGLAVRTPVGAIVLIILGVLFLLGNFGLLQREWFAKAWPVGLIVLGVWILVDRLRGNS